MLSLKTTIHSSGCPYKSNHTDDCRQPLIRSQPALPKALLSAQTHTHTRFHWKPRMCSVWLTACSSLSHCWLYWPVPSVAVLCIVGALAFTSVLGVVRMHRRTSEHTKRFCRCTSSLSDCDANMCLIRCVKENVCLRHSHLCIVLPQQITLPVPFTIWKHFRQADLFNILNAFLQILLQQLPLLLLLIKPWGRAAVLLDSGTGQCL